MAIYQMKFLNESELAIELQKIGADKRCLPFFDNKREVKSLFLPHIDIRAANIIKQEMLSLGGDAAVSRSAVDCSSSHTDAILFGTKKQLLLFTNKIETMTWWNLAETAQSVRQALTSLTSKPSSLKLPHGSTLLLDKKTLVMGIINLTSDSFFTESRIQIDSESIKNKAVEFSKNGADILDIGAESTRPGAERICEEEEIEKISYAVKEIRTVLPNIPISIDTTRKNVAIAALKAGADIINDISGLTFEPEIAKTVAEYNALLILVHMRGTPETMNSLCDYKNLLLDISNFFEEGIKKAESHGLNRSRIILDPGMGFAKNYNQNLYILRNLNAFDTFGLPILIGASRKNTVGKATKSEDTKDRLEGTLAITALCSWHNVDIVRVHDVIENKKVIMMTEAIKEISNE